MPNIIRLVAFFIAFIAGVLLLTSGIHGPTESYQLIIDQLPNFIDDQQILQIANTLALILITLSLAGGVTVIAGGVLIIMHHVGMGKWLIGLGAGVGILWLVMMMFTLINTQQLPALVAEYSTTGWVGLALAFLARLIAK